MDIKPGTTLPQPSPERLSWFEQSYRIMLPSDYLDFLHSGNGGVPLQNVFEIEGRERVVEWFLCLLDSPKDDSTNGWRDITVVVSQLDERLIDDEDLVGINVLPIAALFGGDFVCLDYRSTADDPVVAVWDHELSDEFSPHLEFLAESFTEFTTLLR